MFFNETYRNEPMYCMIKGCGKPLLGYMATSTGFCNSHRHYIENRRCSNCGKKLLSQFTQDMGICLKCFKKGVTFTGVYRDYLDGLQQYIKILENNIK